MVSIALFGASGKMGQSILKLVEQDDSLSISELEHCNLIIDFTVADATKNHLATAIRLQKPLVIGTTGHTTDQLKEIADAAQHIPILHSPNFSFGMAIFIQAAKRIAQKLESPSIQIVETHHTQKKDTPSGTAIAIAKALGKEIPIESIRLKDAVGEHKVIFTCSQEKIELTHKAHSRDAFAKGALLAAKFLIEMPAGLYSLSDLFSP